MACAVKCLSSDFVASRKLSGCVWKIRDRKEPTLRNVGASVGWEQGGGSIARSTQLLPRDQETLGGGL